MDDILKIIHFDKKTTSYEIDTKMDSIILTPSSSSFRVDEILAKTYCVDEEI